MKYGLDTEAVIDDFDGMKRRLVERGLTFESPAQLDLIAALLVIGVQVDRVRDRLDEFNRGHDR